MSIREINDHEFHHDDFEFAHDSNEKLVDKTYRSTSYVKDVLSNFRKNKGAIVGFIIIIIFIIMAIVGPILIHTLISQSLKDMNI